MTKTYGIELDLHKDTWTQSLEQLPLSYLKKFSSPTATIGSSLIALKKTLAESLHKA